MKKWMRILVVVIVVAFVVWVIACFTCSDKIIGGDRDEHGCLGAAGYRWNEEESACVREWETGDVRYQVTNFLSCEAAGYDVMESYPRQCRALNGDVFVEGISPGECLDMGGRTLNVVGGDECYENETNFSPVIGFISPNVCCVPEF